MSQPVVLPHRNEEEALDKRAVRQGKPEFAVTRLRSGPRERENAPAYPPDQDILICVSLTPAARSSHWTVTPKRSNHFESHWSNQWLTLDRVRQVQKTQESFHACTLRPTGLERVAH